MTYNTFLEVIKNKKRISPKDWEITKPLIDKVKAEGVFREFYGDTTVFKLKNKEIEYLEKFQNKLFTNFEDKVVPLFPKTFHLTLQSMSNKYTTLYGGVNEINKEVFQNKKLMSKAFTEMIDKYSGVKIKIKPLALSMSRSGVTIHLYPSSEQDYEVLKDCRNIIEKYDYHTVKEVNIYIPHISLGYLRPVEDFNNYESFKEQIKLMNEVLLDDNHVFELEVDRLTYQYHHNMNDFRDIFNTTNFKK